MVGGHTILMLSFEEPWCCCRAFLPKCVHCTWCYFQSLSLIHKPIRSNPAVTKTLISSLNRFIRDDILVLVNYFNPWNISIVMYNPSTPQPHQVPWMKYIQNEQTSFQMIPIKCINLRQREHFRGSIWRRGLFCSAHRATLCWLTNKATFSRPLRLW